MTPVEQVWKLTQEKNVLFNALSEVKSTIFNLYDLVGTKQAEAAGQLALLNAGYILAISMKALNEISGGKKP